MSFENFEALKAEVQSFMWDRADVVSRIPTFISLAEAEARRLLRTRETNERRAINISSDVTSIPCGAGQIKAIRITENGTKDLDYVTPEQFSSMSSPSYGVPRFYTIQNERVYFYPQGAFTGEMVFIEPFEPLSKVCNCNWLLKQHPDIYLCGALKWGKAWLIDGDWDWAAPFYSAIEAANAHSPRVQTNTTLRADDAAIMARRNGFNIMTGGIS